MEKSYRLGMLLIIFATASLSLFSQSDNFDVKILNPDRDGFAVGKTFKVTGKATIPGGTYLWVLVHRLEGFKYVWYPQSDGEINPITKEWSVTVTFGMTVDIGYDFEIAAIIVDSKEHAILADYVANAMTKGDWRPIKIPPTLCAPIYRKVRKTSDD